MLIICERMSNEIELLSCLKLKPKKCVIVPVAPVLPAWRRKGVWAERGFPLLPVGRAAAAIVGRGLEILSTGSPSERSSLRNSSSAAARCLWTKLWLAKILPAWAEFEVALSARYLGVVLGPEAAHKIWRAPMARFLERARLISGTAASPAAAAALYNSRYIF